MAKNKEIPGTSNKLTSVDHTDKMKVYLVFHNFVSHDMFVPQWAKEGSPQLFGVYKTRKEAKKHIRPWADDYIVVKDVKS